MTTDKSMVTEKSKTEEIRMEQNVKCYAVITPSFDLSRKKYRKGARIVVERISMMDGFLAVDTFKEGMLWIFDSENNAKIARNGMVGMDLPGISTILETCYMSAEEYKTILKAKTNNQIVLIRGDKSAKIS